MSFWRPGERKPTLTPESASPVATTTQTPPTLSSSPKAKSRLSDNVMSMKFMKRSVEEEEPETKDEEDDEDANKRRRLSGGSVGSNVDGTMLEFTLSGHSTVAYPGRRSFGGFNKVVERQYGNILEGQRLDYKYQKKNDDEDGDVNDDELIRRYAAMRKINLGGSSSKKNKKKGGNKKSK